MAAKGTFSSGALSFDLSEFASPDCVLRLGRLSIKNRNTIDTPNYFAVSSRGCVPHISQDMAQSNTGIKGIYVALEDCEYSVFRISMRIFPSRADEHLPWT